MSNFRGISVVGLILASLLSAFDLPAQVLQVSEPIAGEYLVRFTPEAVATSDTRQLARQLSHEFGGQVQRVFNNVGQGFHLTASEAAAEALSHHPLVEGVEQNGIVRLATTQFTSSFTPFPSIYRKPQTNPDLWYLDRIDQPSSSAPAYDGQFNYCTTGAGVRVYVVDTGIRAAHQEFLTNGISRVVQPQNFPTTTAGDKCWNTNSSNRWRPNPGHGTAVASLIGGNTFGVAKAATLVDAHTFNCFTGSAPASEVAAVLNWIATDPGRSFGQRAVVNLSFEYSVYDTDAGLLETAVNDLAAYNIIVVSAAGNAGSHTWWTVPARASHSITVGGTNQRSDTLWSGSNFGYNVSFYAPAQYVESAHHMLASDGFTHLNGRDSHRSIAPDCHLVYDACNSGTSFAAPIVAGMVARYLQAVPSANRNTTLTHLQQEASSGNGVMISTPSGSAPLANYSDCN